jgi:hypothetical protein
VGLELAVGSLSACFPQPLSAACCLGRSERVALLVLVVDQTSEEFCHSATGRLRLQDAPRLIARGVASLKKDRGRNSKPASFLQLGGSPPVDKQAR